MGIAGQEPIARPLTAAPWGALPRRLRVLYITCSMRTGAWLAEAFAADRAAEIELDEALGAGAGLARLREEHYDAVLVSHEPGELDALELVEGLRAAGADEPAVVLGSAGDDELSALCYEVGADAYVCIETATTRNLIWVVARAVERQLLIRENRRLTQAERNRLRLEHSEAERLLDQQRALIRDLEQLRRFSFDSQDVATGEAGTERPPQPAAASLEETNSLANHYRELLRAYVIMGSGNLAEEMRAFADSLVFAGVSAPQAIELHVHVLEELVRGLGSRSARHVMTRADLLVLEVIVHLAERYRQRLEECRPEPQQKLLPGFA
jgi:DNA-binding NarL/FixJ family response regulator